MGKIKKKWVEFKKMGKIKKWIKLKKNTKNNVCPHSSGWKNTSMF